ncbi:MAG: ribosome biogenesis GTPase Der [Patescibacteria group bacterium]|nr:ribosome biogenesis GTPase Der [Patescibacteria group bacterium]
MIEKTILKNNLPTVALIGRANVGKSTFFNTLIDEKKALVSTIAGTTRNNNEGIVVWRGKEINIIDTGGVDNDQNEFFANEILAQAEKALDEADILIMLVDAKSTLLPQEKDLAKKLKSQYKDKKIFLVANKADSKREIQNFDQNYYKLGLGEPFLISATNGKGVGDLIDLIYKELGKASVRPKVVKEKSKTIKVSLIGKPNVGKSSLFNKIIGEEKVIVSDIAHTTREPFDTDLEYEMNGKKQKVTFIDTAGIRRKAKVDGFLEKEGIKKSIETIANSDIILLVLDGSEPISSQDMQLGGLIERKSKSVIILVNKWDLAEDNSDSARNDVKQMVYSHFPHLDFSPILFLSGKTGYKTGQIFPSIMQVIEARHTIISDNAASKFMDHITKTHKPSRGKGTRQPKVFGFRQINADPPVFKLYIKQGTSLHRSYLNFIENKLREKFNFFGTPIVIKMEKSKISDDKLK